MFDMIQLIDITTPIAFALTYLLHSTAWIFLMLCLVKFPLLNTPLLRNYLWKGALIGGLLTSLIIHFSGNSLVEIHLAKENNLAIESKQHAPNDGQIAKEITDAYAPIKNAPISIKEADKNGKKQLTLDFIPEENTIEKASKNQLIIPVAKKEVAAITSFSILKFMLVIGLLFWLLGSLFFTLKETVRHFIFIKKIGGRKIINHPTANYTLNKIQLKLKQKLQIILSQSPVLESPILIRNQEICLPEKAITKLNNEQMEAMLAHEIAHIMRKDYYWNCFFVALDMVFFFQPLHRIAIKEIQATNELLCDEWAAKVIGNNLALAQCLLTVATWMKTPTKTYPLVAGMSLKKSELSDRITSLINLPDMKKQRFNTLKVGLPFITLLALAIFVLPGFTFTSLADTLPTTEKTETSRDNEIITLHEPVNEPIIEQVNEPQNEPVPTKEIEPIIKQIAKEPAFSALGSGLLEQKASDRAVPYLKHDLTTNLEKRKFFPEKSEIKIPFYSQNPITPHIPEFDPYSFDIPLTEKLVATGNKAVTTSLNSEKIPTKEAPPTAEAALKTPTILLEEKFEVNKNHQYFDLFQKVKRKSEGSSKLDIKTIYYANLSCAGTTRQKLGGPLVTNKGDKNSLIFTLDYGDYVEYDTLQNCVHPPGHDLDNWFSRLLGKQIYNASDNNIRGHHPEVVESQWMEQRDNQKQTPMGIKLRGEAEVRIEIKTKNGQPIATIANGTFQKGTHEFVWPHVNVKKGTYRLETTVDGETLSQDLRVKRTRFTNRKGKSTCAALLRAVKGNNIQLVEALVKTTDPNCEYREEGEPRSPLNAAARKGNIAIGKILLAANADVEFRTAGDEGALMGAARHGHLDFVKLMVENGAKINKTVSGDGTALINAVRGGHYEIAEYLLQQDADPFLNVPGDENPIYHATNQGDKMLDLLLKYRKRK